MCPNCGTYKNRKVLEKKTTAVATIKPAEKKAKKETKAKVAK